MNSLPAHNNLTTLATDPFDLSRPGALSPARIRDAVIDNAGFRLMYACQRITPEVLNALQDLADQSRVIERFMAMKKGAVINRINGFASEERQVLHTAGRDLFSAAPLAPEASARAAAELDKLTAFLDRLDRGGVCGRAGAPFTTLVNIGIGGSDLGPRAIARALEFFNLPERKLKFIANVDPDDAACVLAGLDLGQTLVCVVSKSGSTLETLTNEALARQQFTAAGLDPARHFIAVTGKGSPMDNPRDYIETFHMFDYIGGRYSVTSMVGAVCLAFAIGVDNFRAFLKGANRIDQAAEEPDIRGNIPLMMAMAGIWNRNYLGCETLAIIPYCQPLSLFPAHLQQCDMESNGKSININGEPLTHASGPIIWGQAGTNGQHAFFQLLHQGTTVVPLEFIGFRHNQHDLDLEVQGTDSRDKLIANLMAQSLALAVGKQDRNPNKNFPGNRPSLTLIADRLTPETMGELMAIYENKIAFQGFVWNINSFDQEGVQLGKKLATNLLLILKGDDGDPAAKAMLNTAGVL